MRIDGLDGALLGLEVGDDRAVTHLEVVPHLCRTDGRFYGGAALAAALAAGEVATGRPALWSTTQLVATADIGERIEVVTDVVARGRSVDQVQVRGSVGDRLVFTAVGATATPSEDGITGAGRTMPRVPAPDDCEPWQGPSGLAGGLLERDSLPIGHHIVTELRDAPLLDADPERPGHMALWSRLRGEPAEGSPAMTAGGLAFLADMVPIAICRAAGVAGAGTSLDNSLRVGQLGGDAGWVLVELDAHVAVGGYGHGEVDLWSPDGRLLATGTQSARLFDIAGFVAKRSLSR